MTRVEIHQCACPNCQQPGEHPSEELHRRMNLLLSRLDEQQRRWYVALESQRVGHEGDHLLSQITGINVETIRRGRRELDASLEGRPVERVRLAGGGHPPVEQKDPAIEGALPALAKLRRAVIPCGAKWVPPSLHHLRRELASQGHEASPTTAGRLLKKLSIP